MYAAYLIVAIGSYTWTTEALQAGLRGSAARQEAVAAQQQGAAEALQAGLSWRDRSEGAAWR